MNPVRAVIENLITLGSALRRLRIMVAAFDADGGDQLGALLSDTESSLDKACVTGLMAAELFDRLADQLTPEGQAAHQLLTCRLQTFADECRDQRLIFASLNSGRRKAQRKSITRSLAT